MENSWLLLSALLSVAALAFSSKIIKNRRLIRKRPPGPKPWPIIGNLNLVGSIPHQSFHSLSHKYGDLMQLKFGKFPVVVASSPEMAKQLLKVHDAVFASRPTLAAGKYLGYNYSDMSWAPYGPHWREGRKIFLAEVFSVKKLESFEEIRVEERRKFLSRLGGMSGKPVMLRDHLSGYTLSTITRMLLGDRYFTILEAENSTVDMDELRAMFDEWFLLTGVFNIGDWIPWLSFLDLQGYVKKMKALRKKLDRFFNHVIDDHLARRDKDKDSASEDVLDALLQLAENPNLEVKLTRDSVKGFILDLLVGGTDTSATTVEWALHEILRQPRIIRKAKEELDKVIGRNRWVEENDFSQLPFMEAVIMETFRLHPLATLLAPHYAIEDCNISGYDITKGTTVLINAWSIGRHPNTWDAPQEFLPERFSGKVIDVTGSNFALLPFGSGRRRCPGYNLGLKMARTILANLVHGFNLKLVEGMNHQDICMEEEYGLTTHPRHPISIIMEHALPAHLY